MQRYRKAQALRYAVEGLETRRLLSAGGLDPSYGIGGKVSTNFSPLFGSVNGMAATPDGKVVEVGTASDGGVALVRFTANGQLDNTFGVGGKVLTRFGDTTAKLVATCVAIQPDGKIVVGASPFTGFIDDDSFDVLRFNSDGSFDKTFDQDGFVRVNISDARPTTIALQNDGRIVVAGEQFNLHGPFFSSNEDVVVVRLNSNGSMDNTFGQLEFRRGQVSRSGVRSVDLADEHADRPHGMTIDYSGTPATNSNYGKIILTGQSDPLGQLVNQLFVMRLTTSGDLDSSFNGNGRQIILLSSGDQFEVGTGVVVTDSGEIVAAGRYEPRSGSSLMPGNLLVGVRSNGQPDASFGTNGITRTPLGANSGATGIVEGFGQDLIVAGPTGLAAYTPLGKLDPAFGRGGINASVTGLVAVTTGPNRTLLAAGRSGSYAAARFFDIGPAIGVAFNNIAAEQGPAPVTFIVSRDTRLPFATRVFFSVGGTATAPTVLATKNHTNDYTVSGMTFPAFVAIGQPLNPFVDIPADQTFTFVTLTPVDDSADEGTETAVFSVVPRQSSYDIGTPPVETITLLDNDHKAALGAAADATVQDGSSAATNFGTSRQILAKQRAVGKDRQAYIKFDLSSFSGDIRNVSLELHGALSSDAETNLPTQVFAVADTSWKEAAINFNNKPPASGAPLGSITVVDTVKRVYDVDVTAYIKGQLAAGHKIVSFVLINPNNSDAVSTFDSREVGAAGPQLIINANTSTAAKDIHVSTDLVKEGQSVSVIGHLTDPDPGDALTLQIDWGDGTVQTAHPGLGLFNLSHRYAHLPPGTSLQGKYTIHTRWFDQNGAGNSRDLFVNVADVPLTATPRTLSVGKGQQFIATVADFVDPNTLAAANDFHVGINWGDGQSSAGVVVQDSPGHFHVVGSHVFATEFAAPHKILVYVRDNGGEHAFTYSTVNVADSPLDSSRSLTLTETAKQSFANHSTIQAK